jgi:hypothetical protein
MAEIDNKDEVAQIHDDLWESATGKPPRITKYKATQQVLRLIKQESLKAQIAESKLYRKSYPKRNTRANDLSKMTRADLDRHVTELAAELKEIEGGSNE